jgi:hypothetical protein
VEAAVVILKENFNKLSLGIRAVLLRVGMLMIIVSPALKEDPDCGCMLVLYLLAGALSTLGWYCKFLGSIL